MLKEDTVAIIAKTFTREPVICDIPLDIAFFKL